MHVIRRPGPARHRAARDPRGAARLHRGRPPASSSTPPQGAGRCEAGADGGQPHRVQDLTGEIAASSAARAPGEAARRAAVVQADVRDSRLRSSPTTLVQLTGIVEQEGRRRDRPARAADRRRGRPWPPCAPGSPKSASGRRRNPELGRAQEPRRPAPEACATVSSPPGRSPPPSACACSPRTRSTRPPPGATPRSCAPRPPGPRGEGVPPRRDRGDHRGAPGGRRRPGGRRAAFAAEQQRLARLARAAPTAARRLAKLAGQVGARRSRIEAAEAEIGRLQGPRHRGPPARRRGRARVRPPRGAASPTTRRARRASTPATRRPPSSGPPPRPRFERAAAARARGPSVTARTTRPGSWPSR